MKSRLLESLALLAVITPATTWAAQSFVVPITVVPGTVRIQPNTPASLPFSVPLPNPTCAGASGTFSVSIVNGGLEVSFSGNVPPTFDPEISNCAEIVGATMEIELQVPEVGGSGTLVRLDAEPVSSSFSSIHRASASMSATNGLARSSSIAGWLRLGETFSNLNWNADGLMPSGAQVNLHNWIPGDTVRIPIGIGTVAEGSQTVATQGSFRARFVFRVTVPEPSASLSLPIGALGLAGLASMRAGGQ